MASKLPTLEGIVAVMLRPYNTFTHKVHTSKPDEITNVYQFALNDLCGRMLIANGKKDSRLKPPHPTDLARS